MPKSTITIQDVKHTNWENLRVALLQAPLLAAIQGTINIHAAWKTWKEMVLNIIADHVPTRTIVPRHRNKPWMTSWLHRLSKKKHRLFKHAVSTKLPGDWEVYARFRNRCNAEFEKHKKAHFARLQSNLNAHDKGSHRWWNHAKRLAKISNTSSPIPDFEHNDMVASPDSDKANLLADFFASQCSGEALTANLDIGAPYPLPETQPHFEFQPIPESKVFHSLKTLPLFKSSGCSILTNRVLREIAPIIFPSITYLYNLSVSTDTLPADWKSAIITPVFKQRGKPNNPTNYRPISLLPAVGKVLDKLQSQALSSYLVKNSLVTKHQFGFVPGRSTTQQLVYIAYMWAKALDQGKGCAAVFLDFHKAFDKVWHKGLLFKLASIGVGPYALRWLHNYLYARSISVRIGRELSAKHLISAGVPQGSHLGPLLFVIFINDLANQSSTATELYADDALLFEIFTKTNARFGLEHLQHGVTASSIWAHSWNGRFAPPKTELLPIGSCATLACSATSIQIEDTPIKVVALHKHLGITISSSLHWQDHLNDLVTKGKQRSGLLRHMIHTLPPDIIATLYLSHVRPIFEYASPLWHGTITDELSLSLERIQASVARRVLRCDWMTPKEQLFRALDWPALTWRRTIASLTLLHSLLFTQHTGTTPSPAQEILSTDFPFISQLSDRNHRKPLDIVLPPAKTTRFLNTFFYHTSLLWNLLPHFIQCQKNPTRFRHSLEQHWSDHKFNPTHKFL